MRQLCARSAISLALLITAQIGWAAGDTPSAQGTASMNCPKGEELSMACLQKRARIINDSVQSIYHALLDDLPPPQAQALKDEQAQWKDSQQQQCKLNGYAHEAIDQQVCLIRTGLERGKAFRQQWWPLRQSQQQP